MAHVITAATIPDAWIKALDHLISRGPEDFDLNVVVDQPNPESVSHPVVAVLDQFLRDKGKKNVREVRNTIFPAELARTSHSREELYERYNRLLPTLRRLGGNNRGLYFQRLIDYPLQGDPSRSNQLEIIINDLLTQLARRTGAGKLQGPLRSVYEAQIFAPGKDRLPQGFPCMSSLSFQLQTDRALRLTATYRNQYYVERALGNLLGLAALQSYVAAEAGLAPGALTIHAFRAQVDPDISPTAARKLVARCHAASAELDGSA
jgi:thymidylate synthase